MSPGESATERLSLTLPDWRAALKRRFRRPPKRWAKAIAAIVLDVILWLAGSPIHATLFLAFVVDDWLIANHRPALPVELLLPVAIAYVVTLFTGPY